MIHILLLDLQSLDDPYQSTFPDIISIFEGNLVVKLLCYHHLTQLLLLLGDCLLEGGNAGLGSLDFGLIGLEEGSFLETELVGLVIADVCDGFMGNPEGIFLVDILIKHPLLHLQPILLLKIIMILSSSLMQMFHLTLNTLLNLHLLFI